MKNQDLKLPHGFTDDLESRRSELSGAGLLRTPKEEITPEERLYVRFGPPPPKSGRSKNYQRRGETHEGVSVYEGQQKTPGLFEINTHALVYPYGLMAINWFAAADYRAWFVAGEEVGRGSDGEPLVRVNRFWPVSAATNITSNERETQPALELWSRGPRDGLGVKYARGRLQFGSKYSPYLNVYASFKGRRGKTDAAGRKKARRVAAGGTRTVRMRKLQAKRREKNRIRRQEARARKREARIEAAA